MASNDALKATPSEVKKREIAALLRERSGYEQKLSAAEQAVESEQKHAAVSQWSRRINEVNAQLRHRGSDAAGPASRSEKRPTVSARAESR